MKGLRRVVFPLCVFLLLSGAAPAQTNTPPRRYDSRLQMHATPVTLQVPDDSLETQKGAPESFERDLMIQDALPQEAPIRPNGPRLKAMPERQQKNWILPATTEDKNEETTLDQKGDSVSSGWGWLADDVRARQLKQKEQDTKGRNESEDKGDEFQPPSALQKEDLDSKASGIFLDTAFKPVSSSTPAKEGERKGDDETSAQDESPREQKSRADGPTAVESPRNRTAADQPTGQKFGADATWGNESLWNRNSKPVSTLPQTAALLSMSKPDAKQSVAELDLPGFKTDVGVGTGTRADPNRLGPAPGNLAATPSFQPLPQSPVNDFGSTPWDGGLPGKTPYAGSTPFSPESSITPSRPIESLKAPDLPKPVATPWLK